jgi:hypothetical protein
MIGLSVGNVMRVWISQSLWGTCFLISIATVLSAQDATDPILQRGESSTASDSAISEDSSGQSLDKLDGVQLRIINQIKQKEENKDIKENLEIPENYQVQTKKKQDVPEKKVNVWDAESPEPEVKENKNQEKEERSNESSKEDPEKSEGEKENDLAKEKEHVEEPWHEPKTDQ